MNIPWLEPEDALPPVERALRRPNGLLAAGGGLSVPRLLDAYERGCFPWYNEGEPVLWWSPDPRMVLIPKELHISRSLRRRVRRGGFEVRVDHAFRRVIGACAGARDGDTGTWITGDIQRAYEDLHQAGHAHSVETWIDGQLAGGLYGVAIGRAFFGESMFAHQSDASKLALVFLVTQLTRWGFGIVDCQQKTLHLAAFGAREIPRADFLQCLRDCTSRSAPLAWRFDADLAMAIGGNRSENISG